VDHALGDALVVEVGHLLAEDEVLHEHRAARPGGELVLVVLERHAGVRGQPGAVGPLGPLPQLLGLLALGGSILVGHVGSSWLADRATGTAAGNGRTPT
jgi:hypothetical protein